MTTETSPEETEEHPCVNHPRVSTVVACGKCGAYLCPRCMVFTPVGVRCKPCAQLRRAPQFQVAWPNFAAAVAAATILATACWWFTLQQTFFAWILSIAIGLIVGEAVSRITRRRANRPLQIAVGASIFAGYLVARAILLKQAPLAVGYLHTPADFAAAVFNIPVFSIFLLVLAIIFAVTRVMR